MPDRWFSGGTVNSSAPTQVLRTRDAFLFENRREGDFRYRIPLQPGSYELHFYFAERVFGPGNLGGGGETSRLFHVSNGVPLLRYFDVIADAPGCNTADIRIFKDVRPAPDGFLDLRFERAKDSAFVNGIVLLPGNPGHARATRLLTGTSIYRDRKGQVWNPDQFTQGGQVVTRTSLVSGTDDPVLYQAERYGNFSFAIPVAEGRYSVTLHFSEQWWGPGKPNEGGVGSRIFDVHCNGILLLKSFDIFKAAGGNDRAVQRTFRGLTPNAQGKLVLSFVPVLNYGCVNAIEVVAE
jgi:hypothetical protein